MSGKTQRARDAHPASIPPEPIPVQDEQNRLRVAIESKTAEVQRHTRAQADAAKLRRLAEKELMALKDQLLVLIGRGS